MWNHTEVHPGKLQSCPEKLPPSYVSMLPILSDKPFPLGRTMYPITGAIFHGTLGFRCHSCQDSCTSDSSWSLQVYPHSGLKPWAVTSLMVKSHNSSALRLNFELQSLVLMVITWAGLTLVHYLQFCSLWQLWTVVSSDQTAFLRQSIIYLDPKYFTEKYLKTINRLYRHV